jgi:hypothetical protein
MYDVRYKKERSGFIAPLNIKLDLVYGKKREEMMIKTITHPLPIKK